MTNPGAGKRRPKKAAAAIPAKKREIGKKALFEVKLAGRNFKAFTNPVVYLEKDLKAEFELKGKDGKTRLQKLEAGMALRGFKHLFEQTVVAKRCKRLVLTSKVTRLDGDDLHVNVAEYSKSGQVTFLGLYRDAGLAVAEGYLSESLPAQFPAKGKVLTDKEAKKASANLGVVISKTAKDSKGMGRIAKATAEALKQANADKVKLLKELDDLRTLMRQSKLTVYEQDLDSYKARLTKKYKETSGPNHWQGWFKGHSWILGPSYLDPIEKKKVGFEQIPDFILPTLDGFADILELKLPQHEVIRSDPSHAGSWFWSPDASKAIGQASNYIHEAEDNRAKLKEKLSDALGIELAFVKPRAFVIIGVDDDWSAPQKRAFRNLSSTLHGVEVLTYSDIQRRAEAIIKLLKD